MAPIHVVGAGPAGSIAALSALRRGHKVHISEEHAEAGIPRNCSGLFSKDGLCSLRDYIDYRPFVVNAIRGADIYLAGESFSVRRKDAVAFACDRAAMDKELASAAASEGADIAFGERISSISRLLSDNIIGADGPLSLIADSFGFPKPKEHVMTLQAQVRHRSEDPSVIEMHISRERFPGFFAWVIPHDERTAEFGVGVVAPGNVHSAWKHLLVMKGVDTLPKPSGFVIPMGARHRCAGRFGKNTVLLVGDAAGQVKSTTGGGVVFGGNCAALAGRHATDPVGYELAWRSRFGADLAMHAMLHHYMATRSESQLAALGRRIKKTNLDEYLSRHGHMDRPTRMVGTAAIIHLLKNLGGVV